MALAMSGSPAVAAANFPSKPIRIIVPFSAGGATDLMARALAPLLSSRLGGAEIIIENRGGGGGAPAVLEMLRSALDGHTIMLHSGNDGLLTPNISDVGYTVVDIAPIAQVSSLPTSIFVKADREIETLADLMRLGEQNYGKMSYGTTGAGSGHHIVAEALQHLAKKPGLFTHVPFNSGPECMAAVLGGHIDFVFGNASYGETYVKSQGVMKVIATSAEDKCPILPEVPNLRSQGYDFAWETWWGFGARAGTSPEILDILDKAIKDTLTDPTLPQIFTNLGLTINYINRTDFTILWMKQFEEMKVLLKELGLAK